MEKKRCTWVTKDPIYIQYHDEEWGNLENFRDDHYLFEMLTLEGAQAGLSWLTILKRRNEYRKAFASFDPEEVAEFGEEEVTDLMQNEGIIRNERKIRSTIKNAKAFLEVQQEFGNFHTFLWNFIKGKPVVNFWQRHGDVPASNELSKSLSKQLKKRGFSFVGPVICYSYLQAIGLIQDHTQECFLANEKSHDGEENE